MLRVTQKELELDFSCLGLIPTSRHGKKHLPDWLMLGIFVMNHDVVSKRNTLKLGQLKIKLFFKKVEKFGGPSHRKFSQTLAV